jgi:hypothetical protein
MRLLTLVQMDGSTASRVDGDEHVVRFSGELLRKRMPRFAPFRAPPNTWLHPDDLLVEVLLLDHSMGSGTASIGG